MDDSKSPLTANRRAGTELTPEARSAIYRMHLEGKSQRQIAKYFNVSQACVSRIKRAYGPTEEFKTKPRPGRPTELSVRDRRYILRKIAQNPNIQISELRAFGRLTVSDRTIQRFLHTALEELEGQKSDSTNNKVDRLTSRVWAALEARKDPH